MEFGHFVIVVLIIGYSFYRVHRAELEVQVARIDKLEVGLKLSQRALLQVIIFGISNPLYRPKFNWPGMNYWPYKANWPT